MRAQFFLVGKALRLTILVIGSSLGLSCGSISPDGTVVEKSDLSIRVCLEDRVTACTIEVSAGAVLSIPGKVLTLPADDRLHFSINAVGEIELKSTGGIILRAAGVLRVVHPGNAKHFQYERKAYSDTLVIASDGMHLYLLNILPLESYIQSVVPNEIGRNRKSDEYEAIRAQAILARTYALMKIQLPIRRLFDVFDDARDQVFSGTSHPDELIAKAITSTKGQVLVFENRIAETYYHSTCGGRTEAASLVWLRPQSKPYLAGIRDHNGSEDNCRISPSYRWSEVYTRKDFESMLRVYLPTILSESERKLLDQRAWSILDIRITKRSPSGRVSVLKLVLGDTKWQTSIPVSADKIRWIIRRQDGTNILRSTLFDISIEREAKKWIRMIRINGGGNGHGVGLCQWGAIARSRDGQSASQILHGYFPGVTIEKNSRPLYTDMQARERLQKL